MAINFPQPAAHGNAYDFNGIRYTFDDGNAGGGYVAGEGWWYIGTVGTFGSCTGAEIDAGVESVKYATPLAIAESLLVKEGSNGITNFTFNGDVVASTTVTGLIVPGTLTTQNLALLGNLTIPGTLFSGGVESETSVLVDVGGVGDAGLYGSNDNGGFGLYTDTSNAVVLDSLDSALSNPQQVLKYVRGGSTLVGFNGTAKITTVVDGITVAGKVAASGVLSGTDLSVTAGISAVTDLTIDSGTALEVTSQFKTTDGEAKFTEVGGELTLSSSGAGGGNPKTSFVAKNAGAFELYYNGSLMLTTASGGINVTGNVATGTVTGTGDFTINSGAGGDAVFQTYANGGGGYLGGIAAKLEIGTVASGGGSKQKALRATANGATELFYNGNNKMETTNIGVKFGSGFYIDTTGACRNSNNSFVLAADGDLRTTKAIHNDYATLAEDGTVKSNIGEFLGIATNNKTSNFILGNTLGRLALKCDASTTLVKLQRQNAVGSLLNTGITLASDLKTKLYYGNGQLSLNTDNGGGKLTGTWTGSSFSDPSLKKNVEPSSGIENILKLNGVSWDWIDPDQHVGAPTVGFLADNYQDVYPDQVAEKTCEIEDWIDSHQHLLSDDISDEDLRGLAEEECQLVDNVGKLQIVTNISDKTFQADIVESIKFLHNEIQELKAQSIALNERNDVLEAEVALLSL